MADEPISNRADLLKMLASRPGGTIVRTRDQTAMAMLAIIRRKLHPDARMHNAVDGTITITIPPGGTT